MQSPTTLSVIIVTWNGLAHLPRCLACLCPQLPPDAEVILVDNASTDGTAPWVREHYPHVRLLALGRNTGFSGGVDAGLQVARGQHILLINDDAFAEPGFVDALLEPMRRDPGLGSASATLLFAHRPDLVASAGITMRRDGVALDLWAGRAVAELPDAPCPILGPSGGAAIYRRAALDDAGGIPPEFFAYLEDADLALRMRLRGWPSVAVPQARILHVYSATAGQGSPLKQRLLGRNRIRMLVRCLPAALLARCLPHILLYDALACAYALLRGQRAMLAGRLMALAELPALARQRRAIQARATAPKTLINWFQAPPPPWQNLRDAKHLDAILAGRQA